MQLRQYLLELCLDIEHSVKVILLDQIGNFMPEEDGYEIVQKFRKSSNYAEQQYQTTIRNMKGNKYLQKLSSKYSNDPPIWVFLETTSFGGLTAFTEFFYENYKCTKKLKQACSLMRYVKNLRNACAHNTPLMLNIFKDQNRKRPLIIQSIAHKLSIDEKDTFSEKVIDLIAVFYLHKQLQSKRLGEFQYNQGKKWLKRFKRHDWYKKENDLEKFKSYMCILIEFLKP